MNIHNEHDRDKPRCTATKWEWSIVKWALCLKEMRALSLMYGQIRAAKVLDGN